MATDIHKKLIFGALGCGGLIVVGLAAAILAGRRDLFAPAALRPELIDPKMAPAAWDSLSAVSPGAAFALPSFPAWSGPARARGYLQVGPSPTNDNLPLFGDTFPTGSAEWTKGVVTAHRVRVVAANTLPIPPPPYPTTVQTLFRSRILLAAADDWSRHGELGDAVLALDSALSLARLDLQASELERVMTGARIGRDLLDLVSRDTLLSGGAEPSTRARAALARFDTLATRLRMIDHWMMSAGADPKYAENLVAWAADESLPLPWRTAAVRATALGWVFNSAEFGAGVAPGRGEALHRLLKGPLPDSVRAAVDQADSLDASTLARRMQTLGLVRSQRDLLLTP